MRNFILGLKTLIIEREISLFFYFFDIRNEKLKNVSLDQDEKGEFFFLVSLVEKWKFWYLI